MTVDADVSRFDYRSFVDALRAQAMQQPDRKAFTFLVDGEDEKVTWTYADLDRRARAVAAELQSVATPGDRALIVLPTGLDFLAAFFGCFYAGVIAALTAVPRAEQSPDALEAVMRVAEPRVVLTTAELHPFLQSLVETMSSAPEMHWLDVDRPEVGAENGWKEPELSPSSPACLMLTSGSTAAAKGVILRHSNYLHVGFLGETACGLTTESRFMTWAPLHLATGVVGGALQPVYTGTHVTFMSPASFLERPVRWLQAISRGRMTHSSGGNFAYDLVTRTVSPEERDDLDLSTWESAMSGGERVRWDTLTRFASTFAPCGFRPEAFGPAFGMTECTFGTVPRLNEVPLVRTFQAAALERNLVRADPESNADGYEAVGCGYIPPRQDIAIVHAETLTRCAADEVGEIWFRGPNVAHGYWRQPEETERTFHAHLASGEGPYLRSGDLGFLHEGQLFITGRLKELIIIRGRNLYPQDIEHTVEQSHPVLQGHAGAAFAMDVENEEQLVVVQEVALAHHDRSDVIAAIRSTVARVHEVQPSGIILVPPGSIPRTSNGKIQRQGCRIAFQEGRLPVLEQSTLVEGVTPSQAYVPARTPTEATLVQVWEEVLKVERVGTYDSFFELGGDSLLGMQMLSRARQAGIDLTPEQLLKHQTIASLAAMAGQAQPIEAEQGLVTGPTPLAPRQQEFFQVRPEELFRPRRLVVPSFHEVKRDVEPELLEQAVRHLFVHHDALRMRFTQDGDTWRGCYVATEDHDVFSHIDLSMAATAAFPATVMATAKELRDRVSFTKGPLLVAALFETGPGWPNLLLLAAHHLVMDAFSSSILIEDLQTAYEQLVQAAPIQLPPKTSSYKAWAERLAAYASSPEVRNDIDYWLNQSWEDAATLPPDHPAGVGMIGTTRTTVVSCSTDQTNALRGLRRVYRVEMDHILLAALVRGLNASAGIDVLNVGVLTHGRDSIFPEVDVSRTVGWFNFVLPMLLHDRGLELGEMARLIRDQFARIPHGGVGYEASRYFAPGSEIRDWISRLPRTEISFNYHGQSEESGRSWLSSFNSFEGFRDYAANRAVPGDRQIQALAQIKGERLNLAFTYHEKVYAEETIQRVAQSTLDALRIAAEEHSRSGARI